MRIARIKTAEGARHAVQHDGTWHHIVDPFAEPLSYTGQTTPDADAVFLAPVRPAVVLGIGHNRTLNDHPLPIQAWHKSVHTLADPNDPVVAARDRGTVNVEGELAVVIGKQAKELTPGNALEHVLGYTCVNDVTNVDQGLVDERNFQGKAGVNYTPLGPWIETDIPDPDRVGIDVIVNGAVQANSGTYNLPSSVVECLVYVTSWLTLEPGDVLMTGAPGTAVAVQPGDHVEIMVEQIGSLTNRIS
ncbi:2-keto-4-pentenoate hydratase/2-oxohepta-3-ene-1,7-dioic acid hydratase in catechol pathway [Pseudarthrobacter oxydans]|uniref:2-keto-4-pentenoate hydratase/2-oxohepta-3-ene-1,7-dioic acid hydratase in catechol pathway n=1 Tax=Pseudarthrobacter oxydans TaxID=1671 RepID=A0AAW8NDG5_PSEOX|nr:fumarylacetoacetate hydrolase family protein [Pseudarthrobacter oxydans]MDR6793860.1 2-keto-4-pentenoate hydratase/2-oxohepta-3-ene-1,7-dioic acid hydratase in catechol pathway [Pseudarthrobacter oxydans]MDR7165081.1 2-keto-4-pentenoate hydratase/2-oxohepta-3-ene-1,7-dioic acid hydratase in catechol pathway [Pseudarthrobacter oxydans]